MFLSVAHTFLCYEDIITINIYIVNKKQRTRKLLVCWQPTGSLLLDYNFVAKVNGNHRRNDGVYDDVDVHINSFVLDKSFTYLYEYIIA